MTTFPGSPRLLKSGLILADPDTGQLQQIINFQLNPETVSRTLQVQRVEAGSDRTQTTRLTAPAIETITLEAQIDATDGLEFPEQNPNTAKLGIYPQLAALETIVHPDSNRFQLNDLLAQIGTLEIVPMMAPLTLFVWSKQRILPVNITELSITEEAHDSRLNPIRATVNLGMQVLSVNDLPFNSYGGGLFMAYLRQKEELAAKRPRGTLNTLGIGGII